jgi:hypothetical protein
MKANVFDVAKAIMTSLQDIRLDDDIAFHAIKMIYESMLESKFYQDKINEEARKKDNEKNLQEEICIKKLFGEENETNLHSQLKDLCEMLQDINIQSLHIEKKGNHIEVSFK